MKNKSESIEYEDGKRVLLSEDDVPELTDTFFKNSKFGIDGLAELIGEVNVAPLRTIGRPKSLSPKRNGTLRLSAEIWDEIKAKGRGYNSRVEDVLRQALDEGRL